MTGTADASPIRTTPEAQALRARIDAVIFDMDGVLLDISGSIRVVNCLAPPFYLRQVLGWSLPDGLVASADIELFKHAGGFNDDWDLTYAVVLYYLAQARRHPGLPPEQLGSMPPTLSEYTKRIGERGGWLRAAEEVAFEGLSRADRLAVEADYRKPLIRQVFQEMLAGEYCERLYGFRASLYPERGLINEDRVLLDPARVPSGRKLGVQTGRTFEEAMLGMEFTGLDARIPAEHVVTKRDGFHKPEPGGLALLAERLGFTCAVYIGDTLDDLRTVRNFNAAADGVRFLGAQVLTGPAGAVNRRLFEQAGADLIAADVNAVLDWINTANPKEGSQ